MKLVCVTPNPALDRLMEVHGFRAGGVWRTTSLQLRAGGKGLNVARALVRLGLSPVCAGILAGRTGQAIVELAEADGLCLSGIWAAGETRSTTVVNDPDGTSTVINEAGPEIAHADWARFVDHSVTLSQDAVAISISGSLPPGVPNGGLASLIARLTKAADNPVWVDTSGDVLREAIAARPWGIKINAAEAAAVLDLPIRNAKEARCAAHKIHDAGIAVAVVTLGANGAVAVDGEGTWVARPPTLDTVSAVGSGDCFLAGLMAAYAKGENLADALRLATACGAANAMCSEVGDFAPAALSDLMTRTIVEKIET